MPDNEHIQELNGEIEKVYHDLRIHASQLQTPQGRALVETASEVLGGIKKAFDHYLVKSSDDV